MAEKMSYSKDEQETVILYDTETSTWKIESSYGPHITKLLKIANCEIITEHESGKPSMVKAELESPQVFLRNVPQKRELSEEQKLKRSEQMKRLRESRKSD